MRVFAIADPEEHRQRDEAYLNGLRDVGLKADHPVYITESDPNTGNARFENFRYNELSELVQHSEEFFISAYPEALEEIPEDVDLKSEPVYLDRYPLDTAGLQQPSRLEILKDEVLSILPRRESNLEVNYSSASEILRQHGLAEANLKTIDQFLDENGRRQSRTQRRKV